MSSNAVGPISALYELEPAPVDDESTNPRLAAAFLVSPVSRQAIGLALLLQSEERPRNAEWRIDDRFNHAQDALRDPATERRDLPITL